MSNDPKNDDRNRKQGQQQQGAGRPVQGQSQGAGQQNRPGGSRQPSGPAARPDHDKHGSDCGCGK